MVFNSNGDNCLNMKKITLLLLLTLSVLGLQAQTTYQLNYDSIRAGKTEGTGATSLYGKVYLKNVGLGLVSDSILTVLNGRIRKIPTISQFWQRSGTTLSPTTSGDNVSIAVSNANGLIVTNNSATEAAISSRNNGSGNIHQFLNTTGSISAINNNGLLQTATGTDSEFLRSNGTVLGSTGTGNVVRATSPTLVTPVLGNATGGTLSLSGMLTSTQGNNTQIFNSATATTGYQFGRMTNTSGALLWGIEGSVAGTLLTGGATYAGVLTTTTTKNLELGTDQILGLKIDGTNRKVTMPELGGAGDVIIGANNTGLLGEIAIGSGLSLTAGVLTATGGSSGSVTTSGGTAGKITKFTSASNVENSIMTESSGLIDLAGDLTLSGTITTSDDIPFVLSSPTTIDFHQSGSGTVRFVNNTFGAVNMSITNAGDVGVRGTLAVTGAASASNLSGTNTGDQNLAPYATLASPALTGNPTAPTQTAGDNSTNIATTAYVDTRSLSGTYTPTLTNTLNVSSSTSYVWQYSRIGDIVTLYGNLTITPTAVANTELGVSLPVASNFTDARNAVGTVNDLTGGGGTVPLVRADVTNDRIILLFSAAVITKEYSFSISYRIL